MGILDRLFVGAWRTVLPRSWRLRIRVFRGGNLALRVRLALQSRGRIMSGPFQGVRYPPYAVGSEYFPKLLGVYEKELHGVVDQWSKEDFQRIAVVGAGEGYYVGGLAARFPTAIIESFEMDPDGRAAIAWLAKNNGFTRRLRNNGRCGLEDLRQFSDSGERCLLIMDVEGAEEELLDPKAVPGLKGIWILVEAHDCFRPGLGRKLRERFETSHEIEELGAVERVAGDAGVLPLSDRHSRRLLSLLDERRPPGMYWFAMRPR